MDPTGDLFASLAAHAGKATIVRCKITGTGPDLLKAIKAANRKVEAAVKRIIRGLDGKKWEDPDFGPSEDDECGGKSIYRAGKVRLRRSGNARGQPFSLAAPAACAPRAVAEIARNAHGGRVRRAGAGTPLPRCDVVARTAGLTRF